MIDENEAPEGYRAVKGDNCKNCAFDDEWVYEDWIDWNGGECPVGGETIVSVYLKGDPADPMTGLARNLTWQHYNDCGDIIRYRVV